MRTLILAFVLSIPLLYPGPTHAKAMSEPALHQALQNGAIDRMICEKVRYNFGIPKADEAFAKAFMADCLSKLGRLTEARPVFYWRESSEEAARLCTAYTKQSRFDPVSEMLLIIETNDFDECMRKELWH